MSRVKLYVYSELLKNLLSELKLEISYKNIKIDLMNNLRYIKLGFLIEPKNLNLLFKIYSYLNNISIIQKDSKLNKYFDGYTCINKFINNNIYIGNNFNLKYIEEIHSEVNFLLDIHTILYTKNNERIIELNEIRPLGTHIVKSKNKINLYDILKENPKINTLHKLSNNNATIMLIDKIIKKDRFMVNIYLNNTGACSFTGYSIARMEINNLILDIVTNKCIIRTWFIKQALYCLNFDIILIIINIIKEFMV